MVSFDADRTLTSAAEWRADEHWHDVEPIDLAQLDTLDELVVFSAHADDETIGAGGLIALAADRGVAVRVVVATDGDDRRPAELRQALETLGVPAPAAVTIEHLHLPDGRTKHHADELRAGVERTLSLGSVRRWVLAPWPGDRRGDHRTVGREVGSAMRTGRGELFFYPVWLWQWSAAEDVPWSRLIDVALPDDVRLRKQRAIGGFGTQLRSANNPEGVLTEEFLDHSRHGREVLIRPEGSALDRHFERLHSDGADPWDVRTRWYERRKRAITLASLPREHPGRVLEVGCSVGETTALLAERAESVVAVDVSAAAVETATQRVSAHPNAVVRRMRVPAAWPDGRFDLILISEVAYYLAADEWRAVIDRCRSSLTEGGAVVLCHWRGAADDFAQSGENAHEVFRTESGLSATVTHRESDFLLEVFE
ncbi:PIG-L family deacetylase [Leifsonia sp. NPDC058292]|uniref:PIG-L family deacetylase n=1 Tax=Leifsonia sp. NPDC058292 TaxID=3346428 RepID=UPI0036D8A798